MRVRTHVVVEVGVRHGDVVRGVGDVDESVQVVLSGAQVAGEVEMVNPDVGRPVNADGVAVVSGHFRYLEVADDHVADPADVESNTGNGYREQSVGLSAAIEEDGAPGPTYSFRLRRRWSCRMRSGSWRFPR